MKKKTPVKKKRKAVKKIRKPKPTYAIPEGPSGSWGQDKKGKAE